MVSPVFRIPLTSSRSLGGRCGVGDPLTGFDQCFFAGAENPLLPDALARAVDLSERPNKRLCPFSPLVLWGGRGVGKSFLVHGLADRCRSDGQQVVLLNGKNTTCPKINYFRQTRTPKSFWVFDDLDDVTWTKPLAELLACLLDEAALGGWRVLFTLSNPPHQITQLPIRVRDRLVGGMVLKMNPLSLESKRSILREVVDTLEMDMDPGVNQSTIGSVDLARDDFFDVLLSLRGSQKFKSGEQVGVLEKKHPALPNRPGKIPGLATICALTAKHYGTTVRELRGKSRRCGIVLARQVCMYLAHEIFSYSLYEVGLYLGRDRSTIGYGCSVIEKKLLLDLDVKKTISVLRNVV